MDLTMFKALIICSVLGLTICEVSQQKLTGDENSLSSERIAQNTESSLGSSESSTSSPSPYSFGYNTADVAGNQLARQESGDANGAVRGSYSYRDADGLFRTVEYIADENGFRAAIRSNEPGLGNSNEANGLPASIYLQTEATPSKVASKVASASALARLRAAQNTLATAAPTTPSSTTTTTTTSPRPSILASLAPSKVAPVRNMLSRVTPGAAARANSVRQQTFRSSPRLRLVRTQVVPSTTTTTETPITISEQSLSQQSLSEQSLSPQPISQQSLPEQSTEQSLSGESLSQQSLPEPSTEQSLSQKSLPEEQSTSQQSLPEQSTEQSLLGESLSQQSLPGESLSQQSLPEQSTEQSLLGESLSQKSLPEEQSKSQQSIPEQSTEQSLPEQPELKQSPPKKSVSKQSLPKQTAPRKSLPNSLPMKPQVSFTEDAEEPEQVSVIPNPVAPVSSVLPPVLQPQTPSGERPLLVRFLDEDLTYDSLDFAQEQAQPRTIAIQTPDNPLSRLFRIVPIPHNEGLRLQKSGANMVYLTSAQTYSAY